MKNNHSLPFPNFMHARKWNKKSQKSHSIWVLTSYKLPSPHRKEHANVHRAPCLLLQRACQGSSWRFRDGSPWQRACSHLRASWPWAIPWPWVIWPWWPKKGYLRKHELEQNSDSDRISVGDTDSRRTSMIGSRNLQSVVTCISFSLWDHRRLRQRRPQPVISSPWPSWVCQSWEALSETWFYGHSFKCYTTGEMIRISEQLRSRTWIANCKWVRLKLRPV